MVLELVESVREYGLRISVANREPKDARSTGRKRARRVLLKLVEQGEREFHCECTEESHTWHSSPCGWIPDESRPLGRDNNLDADHRNKDWLDNDPSNLTWLCRKCHRALDRSTQKGESRIDDEYGYFEGLL